MNNRLKIGLGVFAAAVAGFFIFRAVRGTATLVETASNANVMVHGTPRIHKLDWSNLTVNVDLRVDNPAKGRVSVKLPSIRMFYGGNQVASTKISDKTHYIEPVSTGYIKDIRIDVPLLTLILTAPTIVNDIRSSSTANVLSKIGIDMIAEANGIPVRIKYNM